MNYSKLTSYLIDGKEFYIYWDVCRNLGIPENKRQGFWKKYNLGEIDIDVISIKDIEKNREIVGDRSFFKSGLYYITPKVALKLEGAWNVYKAFKGIEY